MENIRKHRDIKLVNNKEDYLGSYHFLAHGGAGGNGGDRVK